MIIKKTKILMMFILATNSLCLNALVDYSDNSSRQTSASGANSKNQDEGRTTKSVKQMSSVSSSSSESGTSFSLGSGYENLKGDRGIILNRYTVDGSLRTDFNLFLNVNYWGVSSYEGIQLTSEQTVLSNGGNLTAKLGFNWIKLGGPSDQVSIDLIGGATFGKKNSKFASTRTDKIVGVETTKRFSSVVVGLGYELTLSGNPANSEELKIGNINKLSAGIAVVVSPDITVIVEGATVKIGRDKEQAVNSLDKEMSYSYVTPQLVLKIGNILDWKLGASFLTKSLGEGDTSLASARLWSMEHCYGNSIFTGIGLSI